MSEGLEGFLSLTLRSVTMDTGCRVTFTIQEMLEGVCAFLGLNEHQSEGLGACVNGRFMVRRSVNSVLKKKKDLYHEEISYGKDSLDKDSFCAFLIHQFPNMQYHVKLQCSFNSYHTSCLHTKSNPKANRR